MKKVEYDKISKNWAGKVYETWEKMSFRLELFDLIKHELSGKKIFEIGSNAGLYAWNLPKDIKSYVGIEKSKMYYKQSIETIKYTTKPIEFVNCGAFKYLKNHTIEANVFMSFNVLYHLKNKELKLLKKVLNQCEICMTQIRKEGARVKKNNLKLHTIDGVLDYLGRPVSTIITFGNVSLILSNLC